MTTGRWRLWGVVLVLLPLLSTAVLRPGRVAASGAWASTGSMLAGRSYHTATVLSNGKVLVAGGSGSVGYYGNGSLNTTELYDPAAGTWSPAASMGTPRQEHTATLLPDGKVLVIGGERIAYPGGQRQTDELATAELYDPTSNTWTPAGTVGVARYGHSATLMTQGAYAGQVVILGGDNILSQSTPVERYDPATQVATPLGAPSARDNLYQPAVTLLGDGRLFVISRVCASWADLYNPAANSWARTPSLAGQRCFNGTVPRPDGTVLLTVAHAQLSGVGHDGYAEAYDPVANGWSVVGDLPFVPRDATSPLRLPTGILIVVNFAGGSGRYDPSTGMWSRAPSPQGFPGYGHTVTMLPNGKVLVAGGGGDPPGSCCSTNGRQAIAALYDDTPFALTLTATAGGSVAAVPTPGPYTGDTTVMLTASANPGSLFVGWEVDGVLASYANPYQLRIIAASRAVVARFAPPPGFTDVPTPHPAYQAVVQLAARGIIKGYDPQHYGPDNGVTRAEMAALIARATTKSTADPAHLLPSSACVAPGTWDCEVWSSPFVDRGGLDGNLWRDVETLNHYGVANGYDYYHFAPQDKVTAAQTVAFVARAMVAKGYWQRQYGGAQPYAGVPAAHQDDLATFWHYAQALGGVPDAPSTTSGWNAPATRGWFARVLWVALSSYYAGDHAP